MRKNSTSKGNSASPRTLRDARKASKKNSEKYRASMSDAMKRLKCSKALERKLSALLGWRPYRGKLLASDMEARDELRAQLIALIHSHQRQNPSLRYFFLTMISDEFRVSKRQPELWLKRLRSKCDKAIRMLCDQHDLLGGVCMIEPVFIMNPPDKRRPEYAFHAHALVWADTGFDLPEAKKSLEKLSGWHCSLGLDPIRIKELTPKRGKAAYWAYYMAKHPHDALNLKESVDGSFLSFKTTKGYRPDAKLRLLEGLSQCALADMFFGVKDGKYVRDPVIRRTKAARKLAHPRIKPVDVAKCPSWWRKLWRGSRANHKKAWLIVD